MPDAISVVCLLLICPLSCLSSVSSVVKLLKAYSYLKSHKYVNHLLDHLLYYFFQRQKEIECQKIQLKNFKKKNCKKKYRSNDSKNNLFKKKKLLIKTSVKIIGSAIRSLYIQLNSSQRTTANRTVYKLLTYIRLKLSSVELNSNILFLFFLSSLLIFFMYLKIISQLRHNQNKRNRCLTFKRYLKKNIFISIKVKILDLRCSKNKK